jgi:hypothetical protein
MTTCARLRRMSVQTSPPRPGGAGPLVTLTGLLVLDAAGASHLAAIPDIVGFLLAMLTNAPYRAFPQEITTRPLSPAHVEVRLSRPGGGYAAVRLSHEQWVTELMGMVAAAARELGRVGAGELCQPLLAVLTPPGPDRT